MKRILASVFFALILASCGREEKKSISYETPCTKYSVLTLEDKNISSLCLVNPNDSYMILLDMFTANLIPSVNYEVKWQNTSIFVRKDDKTLFILYEK